MWEAQEKGSHRLEGDSIRSKAISLTIYLLKKKKKKSYKSSTDHIQSKTTVHCNSTMTSKNVTDVNEMMMQAKQ